MPGEPGGEESDEFRVHREGNLSQITQQLAAVARFPGFERIFHLCLML